MELEKTIERTVEFLKTFGKLDEPGSPPVFTMPVNIAASENTVMTSKGAWYKEFYSTPEQDYDAVEVAYDSAVEGLQRISQQDFQKMIIDRIPDSSEFALVDIGSNLGEGFTQKFAHRHPAIKVYMVDRITINDLRKTTLSHFFPAAYPKVDPHSSDDPAEIMNLLLKGEGLKNSTYIHRDLDYSPEPSLPELESELRGKRVIFTGWRNPRNIGFITNDEAGYHDAEFVFSSLTALEKNRPEDYAYSILKQALGDKLSDAGLSKIANLLYDPNAGKRDCEKYDYNDPGQKRFAIALKQLVNLGAFSQLKEKGFDGELLLSEQSQNKFPYNKENHLIYAYKKDNILKL